MPREDATRVRFHEEAPSYKEGEAVEYRSASAGWIPAKVVRVNGNGTYDLNCKQDVPSDRIRAQERGPSFQAGDHVEYFSGSQGKWIPAKVLLQKTDGRLDLDCKQDVSASTVRWPSISSQLHNFTLGDFVEYYSSSQGSWISARVTALKPNGRIDLDCKADVAADSVRQPLPPPGSERLPNLLEPGESVEYFGAKMQRWISAKVLKRNSNGTYDLDCKQNVQPEKLRKGPSQLSSAATSPVGTGALAAYKEGDRVEYFSGSQCRWIPARVLGVTPSGNFNLDCKSDVPSSKIRPPSKNPGDYEVGEVVEYFGASKGLWISTKVLKVNEDGTYDLACKPRVLSGNMRKTSQKEAAVDVKGPVFNIGDSVEYFGVSQGRWIPAKVLSVTAFGNYNLDVKQDVPVDRMRAAVERLADRPAPGDPGSPSHSRNAAAMRGISGATLSAVAAFAEPMQLLRYRSGLTGGYKLELCKDAVKTLESMGQRSVVAISLCGTSQSGKTYLANHLLDRPQQGQQVLQVGGLWSKARTEGVWLWAGGVDKDERSPLILILDCEGFGGPGSTMDEGHGASRDMQILALCWLLSSALVMNCMGGLNEDLFDELKSASHFGDIVEERGTEAYGKPALLWLLRDFEELPKDDKGRSITADEYLEQSMHGREVSKESARKAGNVRHGLLKFFRHRSCHVVPSPGSRPEGSSYAALSKPFKAAMEQFRSKLFAAALACPKAVNGRPLGCVAFAAVLRQLVASVNDGRILSLHAAWESVQHTFCGSLSDELRAQASTLFQSLAAGRSIEGGAKLPLSEEALFTVVRDRKRALKAEWEERAFGDESVRRTYWKELKTSLAREENMVRTQNARVADQQLMEGVKSWQEWLDKEDDTRIDQICNQLGALLARMPAAPVSRASRIAMQAAARRMSAMRSAVTNALERHTDLQRKAVEWGEKAAQQEGSARSELEAQKAALEEAAARAEKAEEECKALSKEIESQEAQLDTNRENLQDQLEGLEASRLREQDMKAKLRVLNESEASLRKDLEQARADVARIDAERFAAERSATQAASAAQAEQDRLKELLQEAQRKIEETKSEVCRERDAHGNEKLRLHQEHEQRLQDARNKHENERQVLRTKQDRTREEHLRMAEEMRQKLEEERQDHNKTKDDDKGRLLEHSRTTGILEGKIIASSEENKALRLRLDNLEEKAHETEVAIRTNLEEERVLRAKLHQAQAEVARMKEDVDSKLKAAAEELDVQEREMQEREAEMERASTGLGSLGLHPGQPKCGCRIQ